MLLILVIVIMDGGVHFHVIFGIFWGMRHQETHFFERDNAKTHKKMIVVLSHPASSCCLVTVVLVASHPNQSSKDIYDIDMT